jgi:hypothetical protein
MATDALPARVARNDCNGPAKENVPDDCAAEAAAAGCGITLTLTETSQTPVSRSVDATPAGRGAGETFSAFRSVKGTAAHWMAPGGWPPLTVALVRVSTA